MMFWRELSLRSKLLIMTMAGLLSLGIFASIQTMTLLQSRQEMLKGDFKSRTVMASQAISSVFYERYMDVQAFASNSIFQSLNRDIMVQTLNGYVEAYKAYDAIVFVDAEGKFVASNSKTFDGRPIDVKNLEGRSFADTTWFQRSIKGEFLEDRAKGISGAVVDDFQVDSITTALFAGTHYGMSFSRAVFHSDGRVAGVITARASLRFVETELRGFFDALVSSGIRSGKLYLINKDGLMLSEVSSDTVTDRSELRRNSDRILRWNLVSQQGQMSAIEALAGRSGALIEADRVERIERLWGYDVIRNKRFLEQLGWSVIFSAATQDVFADLNSHRRWFFVGFFVMISLFGLFGYGFARSIAKEISDCSSRIKDETAQMIEIGDGMEDALRKASNANHETGVLARTVAEGAKEVFSQQRDSSDVLVETSGRLREFQSQSARGDQAVQRVAVEMTLAKNSVEQLSFLEKELEIATTKLGLFSELIYKLELLSYNSLIEAQRAGSHGKGFTRIANDFESIVEAATTLHRELTSGIIASQAKAVELMAAIRRSVHDGEALISETQANMAQFRNDFVSLAETVDHVRTVMMAKEDALRNIFDSISQLELTASRSNVLFAELSRGALDIRDQGERLDDLIQDLSAMVKGQKVRHRNRRGSSSAQSMAAFNQQLDLPPDQARATVVDRLAQKMRPRLVVKTDDSEPEIQASEPESAESRKVG